MFITEKRKNELKPLPNDEKKTNTKKERADKLSKAAAHLRYVNCHVTSKQIQISEFSEMKLPEVPTWGGGYTDQFGVNITLSNTCPVDNYIAMLSLNSNMYQNILTLPSCPLLMKTLLSFIKNKQFTEAKILLFDATKVVNNTMNFWGNEHEQFVDKFNELFTLSTITECSSEWCPKKQEALIEKKVQSLPSVPSDWFNGIEEETVCNRAFQLPINKEALVNWNEFTTEDGVVYVYHF